MERVNENEPAVRARRFDAGLQMPVSGSVGFLDLFLRETKTVNSAPGSE